MDTKRMKDDLNGFTDNKRTTPPKDHKVKSTSTEVKGCFFWGCFGFWNDVDSEVHEKLGNPTCRTPDESSGTHAHSSGPETVL